MSSCSTWQSHSHAINSSFFTEFQKPYESDLQFEHYSLPKPSSENPLQYPPCSPTNDDTHEVFASTASFEFAIEAEKMVSDLCNPVLDHRLPSVAAPPPCVFKPPPHRPVTVSETVPDAFAPKPPAYHHLHPNGYQQSQQQDTSVNFRELVIKGCFELESILKVHRQNMYIGDLLAYCLAIRESAAAPPLSSPEFDAPSSETRALIIAFFRLVSCWLGVYPCLSHGLLPAFRDWQLASRRVIIGILRRVPGLRDKLSHIPEGDTSVGAGSKSWSQNLRSPITMQDSSNSKPFFMAPSKTDQFPEGSVRLLCHRDESGAGASQQKVARNRPPSLSLWRPGGTSEQPQLPPTLMSVAGLMKQAGPGLSEVESSNKSQPVTLSDGVTSAASGAFSLGSASDPIVSSCESCSPPIAFPCNGEAAPASPPRGSRPLCPGGMKKQWVSQGSRPRSPWPITPTHSPAVTDQRGLATSGARCPQEGAYMKPGSYDVPLRPGSIVLTPDTSASARSRALGVVPGAPPQLPAPSLHLESTWQAALASAETLSKALQSDPELASSVTASDCGPPDPATVDPVSVVGVWDANASNDTDTQRKHPSIGMVEAAAPRSSHANASFLGQQRRWPTTTPQGLTLSVPPNIPKPKSELGADIDEEKKEPISQEPAPLTPARVAVVRPAGINAMPTPLVVESASLPLLILGRPKALTLSTNPDLEKETPRSRKPKHPGRSSRPATARQVQQQMRRRRRSRSRSASVSCWKSGVEPAGQHADDADPREAQPEQEKEQEQGRGLSPAGARRAQGILSAIWGMQEAQHIKFAPTSQQLDGRASSSASLDCMARKLKAEAYRSVAEFALDFRRVLFNHAKCSGDSAKTCAERTNILQTTFEGLLEEKFPIKSRERVHAVSPLRSGKPIAPNPETEE